MSDNTIMAVGLTVLSIASGMLGLGVAFAVGSFVGARITSLYVPGKRLKQMFGLLIVVMTAYKIYQILSQ